MRRFRGLLIAVLLLVIGVPLALIRPSGRRALVFQLPESLLALLQIAGFVIAALGLGLLLGELFGTDSALVREIAADGAKGEHPVTGSNAFLVTAGLSAVSLLVSVVTGHAVETGPDVMGAFILPFISYLVLLGSAARLGYVLSRAWPLASRREKLLGLAMSFGAVPWIIICMCAFDAFTFPRA